MIDTGAELVPLSADRVRMINRLRDLLTSMFPALEREFDYKSCKGAVLLISRYAAAPQIRRTGQTRLAAWLRRRQVRGFASIAQRALAAARSQTVALPGEQLAASIVNELATTILALDRRNQSPRRANRRDLRRAPARDDHPVDTRFGPVLGASLIVAAGDLTAFHTAGHLAAAAGLVPFPNDSGRRSGNLRKPRRYNRPLRHALYLSAQTSMIRPGPNRDYYLKKRGHGRTHNQAVIAVARRRVDMLWALLRDNRMWTSASPTLPQAA